MPGVGWCVRSGLARYRIMFADGVALEVDVDEERVEMVERDGSVVQSVLRSFLLSRDLRGVSFFFRRYTVRECSTSREVGDRMKVFRKFLPLFDDE
jgi:polo-like kinase 4